MSGTMGCVFDLTDRWGRGTDDAAWCAVQELVAGKRSSVTAYFVPVPYGHELVTFSLSQIPEDWRFSADAVIKWMRKHWRRFQSAPAPDPDRRG